VPCVTALPPRPAGSSDDERPSWMGAPGYTPYADDLPPHAPMPGAPPYPAAEEAPPPPVGRPPARTRFRVALGASAVWAAVNLVLTLVVAGAPGGAGEFLSFVVGVVVSAVLAALVAWLVGRGPSWSFWFLLLVTAPLFWVLRAVLILLVG
jgi:hypothetical protein